MKTIGSSYQLVHIYAAVDPNCPIGRMGIFSTFQETSPELG